MKYNNIIKGTFVSRPNRFIAHVEIDGIVEICHVKNTGRCKELLIEGVTVVLEQSSNPLRKTKFDLIAVYKGEELINIDSQAPNKVFGEWIESGNLFEHICLIKPECKYKNSRFDFYVETLEDKIFVEVKGVTLERDGVLMFPDAPTQRGVKHINELIDAVKHGYKSYIVFVAQMENCKYFTPNVITHPEFGEALKKAGESGVKVICVNCFVEESTLNIKEFVEVRL